MTACRNKASRAVTAALVGVLSVGAVPMVALAQTDGASLFAISTSKAWEGGTITAENGEGEAVDLSGKDLPTFTTGSGEYLLPTSITVEGDKIDFDFKSGTGNARVEYKDNSTGTVVCSAGRGVTTDLAKNYDWKAGTYTAEVTFVKDGSLYDGQKVSVEFKVVDVSLENAQIFNATGGNTDVTKTSFTYNGGKQDLGLFVDGEILDEDDDYDVVISGVNTTDGTIENAGSYTAYVYKNNHTAADKPAKVINFTVGRLDLTSASITIDDVKVGTAPTVAIADGVSLTSGQGNFSLVVTGSVTSSGPCNAVLSVAEGNINLAPCSGVNVTFNVVDTLYADGFRYGSATGGTSFAAASSPRTPLTIDLGAGQAFDEGKIEHRNVSIDAKDFDVTYFDAITGEQLDASALSEPGLYRVCARINAGRAEYAMGSPVQCMYVNVVAPKVDTDDVVFKYKGEVCGDSLAGLTYTGEDYLEDITATVKYGDKTLVAGEDYELVVLDEADKAVESIVNAGTYTVIVKSDSYDIDGNELTVTVSPVSISHLYAKSDLMRDFVDDTDPNSVRVTTLISYTGEEIEPNFTFGYYTDKDGKPAELDDSNAEDYTWHELPEGAVLLDGIRYADDRTDTWTDDTGKAVDGLKDKGYYGIFVSLSDDVVNYELDSTNVACNTIWVTDAKVFLDVANDAWYAGSVYTAYKNGYIFGYSGSMIFGPADSMTRADVATVLYRVSGQDIEDIDEGAYTENWGWDTGYVDCDGKAYYAEAVAWARKAGVVSGYDAEHFGPTDPVTREQFASMLANFARVTGHYEAADESVLGNYADGGSVSAFAKGTVAWAVESGVMGGADTLRPTSEVSRADVATMVVNYKSKIDPTDFIL